MLGTLSAVLIFYVLAQVREQSIRKFLLAIDKMAIETMGIAQLKVNLEQYFSNFFIFG